MLILFFDTFIISDTDKGGIYNHKHMENALSFYRDNLTNYTWKKKIDIVKYTLCSYSKINWDKVVIRFECENNQDTILFYEFCRNLFPNALIENERSSTAKQYYEALMLLDNGNNPWIFFSPNNDHPYIADPLILSTYLEHAKIIESKYLDKDVSILYSHFTESMIDNKISDPQWGYFESNFKKILYEDPDFIATVSNKLSIDSVKIFRINYLLRLFQNSKNNGRVIRLEDTGFHLKYSDDLITIAPKVELCRHYDSYAHLMKWIPPLFIPPGFFEFNIKIRYGYDNYLEGWVNVNPNMSKITSEIDLCCFLEDLPFFWTDRVSVIDSNPKFEAKFIREESIYYKNLFNPFHYKNKMSNILRSLFVWVGQVFPWRNSAVIVYFILVIKQIGIYKPLRAIWKFKPF